MLLSPSERVTATAPAPDAAAQSVLPAPVEPLFRVPSPRPLGGRPPPPMWAQVLREVVPRAQPGAGARPLEPLPAVTPEGTDNIVLVEGRLEDALGRVWVRVRLPTLPRNSSGWVPRDVLGGAVPVRTRLVVDLERLTATLFDGERVVLRAPVGVGEPRWPTPTGSFYVRNRVTSFRSPFYGPLAFGTSARSAVLTDWPAGGWVGIHGTNRPDLIPGRVSHGCIRLRNPDLLRLARLMPVGTPITIR